MDKSVFKSVTFWSALAMAFLQVGEQTGALPTGTQNGLMALAGTLAQLGVIFGLRKAIG